MDNFCKRCNQKFDSGPKDVICGKCAMASVILDYGKQIEALQGKIDGVVTDLESMRDKDVIMVNVDIEWVIEKLEFAGQKKQPKFPKKG